ncbi:MAG: hypothetical protein IJF62_05600 [Firmicutes bacterium]|nr:hypothetical protein [Bacillota bacterium]MBQ6842556.1 hypothetical protein [Bacillota bacterium]
MSLFCNNGRCGNGNSNVSGSSTCRKHCGCNGTVSGTTNNNCNCNCNCSHDCDCECKHKCHCKDEESNVGGTTTENCNCNCTCTCTCTCQPSCPPACNCTECDTTVSGSTDGEMTVNAMLQTVIDSCCTTTEITREFTFPTSLLCPDEEVVVGQLLRAELNGDVTFQEISREKDDCLCTSSARFQIPIRFLPPNVCDCGCTSSAVERVINVIRTTNLCCTRNSQLTAFYNRVTAINAVVNEVGTDTITVNVTILFTSCLAQTLNRVYSFRATPVCEYNNCDTRVTDLTDRCDMTCGCVSGRSCPSC